jgi:DNA-directed RNA polymerase subunit RPC12/RpoP
MQQLQCANCGAPIEIENQFIRSVTCRYCDSSYLVNGSQGLDPAGKSAGLADFPSRLNVGMRGKMRGRGFRVLGRVRYSYKDGFWEEWQVAWDDGAPPDWLEEDEGYWTLYRRERVKSEIPPYDNVRVGSKVTINGKSVFITEKRTGKMIGSEGQFSSVLPLKGSFGYIQGSTDGKAASVNYWDDEIELSVGDELEPHELTIG